MTSSAPSSDGNGGQAGGIGMARIAPSLDEIGAAVDKAAAAQDQRQRSIVKTRRLLIAIGGSGDDPYVRGVIAATNAAAAEALDDLLRTLRLGGIGTPLGGDLDASTTDMARSPAQRRADAGYSSPAAVARWTAIGIDTPAAARKWVEAGFTAESASRWVQVPDMTPAEAATCATAGLTPTDVRRIRRADPGWARTEPEPETPTPDVGISM